MLRLALVTVALTTVLAAAPATAQFGYLPPAVAWGGYGMWVSGFGPAVYVREHVPYYYQNPPIHYGLSILRAWDPRPLPDVVIRPPICEAVPPPPPLPAPPPLTIVNPHAAGPATMGIAPSGVRLSAHRIANPFAR